jgi:polysaccharide export outer membrane protein
MKIKPGKIILTAVLTLLLAGVLFVSGPLAAFGQEEVSVVRQKPRADYNLGAGDLVQVVVWKNEDVSGEFRVRPDGKFSMPLIGDILAEGNTADSISMQVEQKLKLFIESPYVSTIVVEAASNRIYVLGEVANPGAYAVDGSLTVLQALALAGGFTEFASKEKMVLVRGVGVVQINTKLSYSKIIRTPGEESNPIMERGDTLVVP